MIELLNGALRFNVYFFCINLIVFGFFIYQWFMMYKRTGVNLDFWIYNMLLIFVIPFVIMYPFASSYFNVLAVGTNPLETINNSMDRAYLITLLGFVTMLIGKVCYDKFGMNKLVKLLFYTPFKQTIGLYFKRVVLSSNVSHGLALVYILILILFVTFTVSSGFASNPRAFFMANPQFRPFYNLITSLFGIVTGLLTTRIIQDNKLVDKILLLPIIMFGFFLGVRAPIIFQGLSFGVMFIIYRRKGYVPVYKMVLAAIATLFVIVILVVVRNAGGESVDTRNATAIFVYEIFYGNTFSDLRDFSWVIGNWNEVHLWGMSYISAFLSFIPSTLLPFREKWGIGKITVNMLGFDTTIHPGLRPGFFGEMYLNFDIFGVIIYAFVWAQVIQNVNVTVKENARKNNVVEGNSVMNAASFVAFLSNSAGFFGFYVNFMTLFVLYILTRIRFNK